MTFFKVKDSVLKTKDELEESFSTPLDDIFNKLEGDPDAADAHANIAHNQPEPDEGEGYLIPTKTFTGGLIPNLKHYLPTGLELTEAEVTTVLKGIKNVASGLRTSVPINCYGDSCPFKAQCPFHQIGKAPVGKPCPVEMMMVDMYTKRYIDEFDVDSDYMSEVTTMTMLAATHVLEMRALIILGKDDPTGLIKNVVGFNNEEEPIVQLQEHPALNILERAWRWRRNLLESLVGTRKEKYKRDSTMGGVNPASVSSAAADMRSTIEKLSVIDITEDED